MPTNTRRTTTDAHGEHDAADQHPTADEAVAAVKTTADEAAAEAAAGGSGAAGAVRQIITAPATVARAVADDVVATVRRPDAVLYIGGLVGLAVVGVLEWPVAAVAGIGVAVANGRRRARA